jgi:preprotein translocase subunit SecF
MIALLPVAAILAVSVFLLGNGELKDLALVLFVGMLSGTYSSICIATPVLADLKEREPEFRQLRKQIAQRASSTKRQAKVAVASAPGAGAVADDPPESAAPAEIPAEPEEPEATPVTAARPAGGSGAPRPSSGPRQQPRRSSAAQRRPSGKKKRR